MSAAGALGEGDQAESGALQAKIVGTERVHSCMALEGPNRT